MSQPEQDVVVTKEVVCPQCNSKTILEVSVLRDLLPFVGKKSNKMFQFCSHCNHVFEYSAEIHIRLI